MKFYRLAVLFVAMIALASCSKPEKLTFPTAGDARAAGAVDHGYLPGFLPADAVDLQVRKDAARPMALCKLPAEGFEKLKAATEAVPADWKHQMGYGFYRGDFRPADQWSLLYEPGASRPWYFAYDTAHHKLVLWR